MKLINQSVNQLIHRVREIYHDALIGLDIEDGWLIISVQKSFNV